MPMLILFDWNGTLAYMPSDAISSLEGVPPSPGLMKTFTDAKDALQTLAYGTSHDPRKKHTLALCSNTPQRSVQKSIDCLGLTRYFWDCNKEGHPLIPRVYTPDTADGRPKPDPAMLLLAMQSAQFTPEQTILVGNGTEDMQAAEAAGLPLAHRIGFINPSIPIREAEIRRLKEAGAGQHFSDYSKLPDMIATLERG